MSKYYAIGDIHGMLAKLESLLDIIPVDRQDTLIFLGDYLNRGPKPRGVIERIINLRKDGYRVVALKGNHEAVFLNLLKGKLDYWDYREWFDGESTLRDYSYYLNYAYKKEMGVKPDPNDFFLWEEEEDHRLAVPLPHLRFLETLPLYYETEDFIFVHAGLRPGFPLREQREEDLLWITDEFIHSEASFGKIIVHGHTGEDEPVVTKTRIGVDTGAGFGGKLSCVCLPEVRFYAV